jgi:hypothetical protein
LWCPEREFLVCWNSRVALPISITPKMSQERRQCMAKIPDETDVLVPFEIANFPGEYREYYGTKRHNLFAMIQKHPEMWSYFHMIDQILHREIDDLQVSTNVNDHLPRAFYINAHAKIRIAMELAFQGCMQECRSVLRDAVEWAAYAHYMMSDPALQRIWWEQDEAGGRAIFDEKFVHKKRLTVFAVQDELHQKFGELSEGGSHPTPTSMFSRIVFTDTPTERGMRVYYSGVPDERGWAIELFSRLLTCFVIEQTFFNDFRTRLELDPKLMSMRQEFAVHKERLRPFMIQKYNIKDPGAYPTRRKAPAKGASKPPSGRP